MIAMRTTLAAMACVTLTCAAQAQDLHSMPVQGNVYMIVGAGGNIAVQVGKQGVLVVDSGRAADADKVIQEIRKISDNGAIRYILNSSADADHVGANEKLAASGKSVVGGNMAGQLSSTASEAASIIAHENVLNRMSAPTGKVSPTPQGAWPNDTFFVNQKNMFFDGEAIQMIHEPAAHTDGDTMVFFRRSDVIVTGDIFNPGGYPVIDTAKGGSVNGVLAGLNEIIRITIPADKQEGGTYVIPGRGRLCDQADVVEYRDMLTIIRDRVQDMVKKGMTWEQVKATKPTRDYDPLYGATSGPWTNEMFLEAVYKSLSAPKK
jgi:cyclase